MTTNRDNENPLVALVALPLVFCVLHPIFRWPRSAWASVWYGPRSRRPWLMAAVAALTLLYVGLSYIPHVNHGFQYLLIDTFVEGPQHLGSALFVDPIAQVLVLGVFFPFQIALLLFVTSTFAGAPIHWALLWREERKDGKAPGVAGLEVSRRLDAQARQVPRQSPRHRVHRRVAHRRQAVSTSNRESSRDRTVWVVGCEPALARPWVPRLAGRSGRHPRRAAVVVRRRQRRP